MECLWCMKREATVDDLVCQPCADELSQEDMQGLRGTVMGQRRLILVAGRELVQAIKAELPRPLRRLFK